MTRFPIDLLAPEALGLPGRLLMGPAPDLTDLDAELQSLRQDHGVDRLVCFLEAHELEALGLGDLPSSAEATGISTRLFPIPDGSVPKSPEAMDTLVRDLLEALSAGNTVFLHCWAGLGRTGTVAAACLVARGMGAREAIQAVRQSRPGTVESAEQEAFLATYARWRKS